MRYRVANLGQLKYFDVPTGAFPVPWGPDDSEDEYQLYGARLAQYGRGEIPGPDVTGVEWPEEILAMEMECERLYALIPTKLRGKDVLVDPSTPEWRAWKACVQAVEKMKKDWLKRRPAPPVTPPTPQPPAPVPPAPPVQPPSSLPPPALPPPPAPFPTRGPRVMPPGVPAVTPFPEVPCPEEIYGGTCPPAGGVPMICYPLNQAPLPSAPVPFYRQSFRTLAGPRLQGSSRFEGVTPEEYARRIR